MRLTLYHLKGKAEPWADQAATDLAAKISAFLPFESVAIKSRSADRDNLKEKRRGEADALLKKIEPSDTLVLLDEGGREFKSSEDFSSVLIKLLGRQGGRVVLAMGGPYGFDLSVYARAQEKWSLSRLTMNHHVARIVALEQIYRAFAIWKGLPYHN